MKIDDWGVQILEARAEEHIALATRLDCGFGISDFLIYNLQSEICNNKMVGYARLMVSLLNHEGAKVHEKHEKWIILFVLSNRLQNKNGVEQFPRLKSWAAVVSSPFEDVVL